MGDSVKEGKDAPLIRYLVIWSPFYEKGGSRHEAIEVLHYALGMKAPQLVTRRKVELKETSDSEIIRKCSEWMELHWGKHLKHNIKSLSIIAITDPVWQEVGGEGRWKESVERMRAAQAHASRRVRGKPQQCYLDVERSIL